MTPALIEGIANGMLLLGAVLALVLLAWEVG